MRSNFYRTVAILVVLVLTTLTTQSEELILREGLDGYTGTADASLYEDQSNNANGGHPLIFSGATGTSVRRALIRFDLATIPPDSNIEAVELRLVVNRSGPSASSQDAYTLHRLTTDWGEGEVDSPDPGGNGRPAQLGDATWLSNFHQESQWETPGGDFVETASAQADVGSQLGAEALFTSEGMAADIQAWVDDPDSNFGWILIGPEDGDRNARRFVSSEGTSEASRPTLRIEYTEPVSVSEWNLY